MPSVMGEDQDTVSQKQSDMAQTLAELEGPAATEAAMLRSVLTDEERRFEPLSSSECPPDVPPNIWNRFQDRSVPRHRKYDSMDKYMNTCVLYQSEQMPTASMCVIVCCFDFKNAHCMMHT